jgi:DNA-binding beta-propeller fold protein YncE
MIRLERPSILIRIALLLLLASCSPDEPIIDNTVRSWRLLLVHANGTVADVTMPEGTSTNPPSLSLVGGVEKCRQYRDDLYALSRDSALVVVVDARTMVERQRISLDTAGPAADIIFANATTAYALHAGTNVVSVIDLTVGVVVQQIAVGDRPIAGAVYGNQLGIVCQGAERLDVIDSRTNAVEASVPIAEAPAFIDVDPLQQAFCITTLGAGRVDRRPTTTPKLWVVRISDRAVLGAADVTNRDADGPRQRVGGMAIAQQQFAYVPATTAILRVNLRTRARATAVLLQEFHAIAVNDVRNEMLLLNPDSVSVDVYSDIIDAKRASFRAATPVRQMLPLPPR